MKENRENGFPAEDNGLKEILPIEEPEEGQAAAEDSSAVSDGTIEEKDGGAAENAIVQASSEGGPADSKAPSGNETEKKTSGLRMPEWFPMRDVFAPAAGGGGEKAADRKAFLRREWWTPAKIIAATVAGAAVIAAAAGIATYHRHAVFYDTHFFEGTIINGIDVSGMTTEEVETLIRNETEDYALALTFRGGDREVLTASDLGYAYVSDGSVGKMMDSQNGMLWLFANSKKKDGVTVQKAVSFDRETAKAALEGLQECQKSGMEAPEDAALTWDGQKYIITPEVQGTTLDTEKVFTAVCDAVDNGTETLDIEKIDGAYAAPKVYADDEKLNREEEQLNELLTAHVTLDLPEGKRVLDGSTMKDWLAVDDEGNYYRDETLWQEKIDSFIEDLEKDVNTINRDRTFTTTEAGTVTIIGNDYYGWEIDTASEHYQLPADLESEEPVEREPFYLSTEVAKKDDHDGVGPNYVEADLTAQHVWLYIDGKMVYDSDLVSGDMVDAKYTPEGVYPLMSKQENAVLVGNSYGDGVYEYMTRVNYWMPFTRTGIGLHDATWRSAFGGDIYMTDGSHGCLNLPLEAAKTIYGYVEKGMPVVVYYSDGNPLETRMTEAEKAEKEAEQNG